MNAASRPWRQPRRESLSMTFDDILTQVLDCLQRQGWAS